MEWGGFAPNKTHFSFSFSLNGDTYGVFQIGDASARSLLIRQIVPSDSWRYLPWLGYEILWKGCPVVYPHCAKGPGSKANGYSHK